MVALAAPHQILDLQHRIQRRMLPEHLVNQEGDGLKDQEENPLKNICQ